MPTGYTADIAKGITFQQYALNCARAFGALVTMRDDPGDAEIPEAFTPSTYHVEQLDIARQGLARLEAMTQEELEAETDKEYKDGVARYEQFNKEREGLRAKYEDMLKQAAAWMPPTEEHNGLKRFMISQIEKSIKFDCGYTMPQPTILSANDWLEKQTAQCVHDIEYHKKEQDAENQQIAERNKWIQDLRKSLL